MGNRYDCNWTFAGFILKMINQNNNVRHLSDFWISVQTRLPYDGQKVSVKGIPSGETNEITIDITYWDDVGFISNITHWKNRI